MDARKERIRMGTKIGAALGGVLFLVFGLFPGFYFGSYGALTVLRHLMGSAVEATVLMRLVIAVGSMLGIVCTASVSIVVGSIAGTLFGYLVEAVSVSAADKKAERAAAN